MLLRGMTGIHLSKRIRTWIHCVGAGVWISGVGWIGDHYLFAPRDTLVLTGTSEPLWLKIHGAFAFLTMWTAGLLWGMHIVKAWLRRRRRWSGSTLLAALMLLMLSGYLLYYAGGDRLRAVISLIHQVLGLAILPAYLIHRLAKKPSYEGPPASRL
jgi:hypothetical protein